MRVLFLSSWFPNRNYPYNGDFVERHALAVADLCNVAVIYVIPDDNVKGQVFEITEKYNRQLYEIIIYFKRNTCGLKPLAKLINLTRYGKGYYLGNRLLRKKFGRPEIIHGNIIFPIAIVAWFWKILTGIPFIITEHWTLYLAGDSSQIPGRRITRAAIKRAFAVTTVTKNLEKALRRHGYESIYKVIPNVVDTEIFFPDPAPVSGDKVKILHVSSMKEDQKNITGIIRTVKQLSLIRNDFIFTFIGEPQEQQRMLAGKLGLSGDIIVFKGEMSHNEVAENMRQSHFLVMFSKVENLPCVILEALSCGLPVLSSDTGGIPEWINDKNGLLVKPGNEKELLSGFIYMLDNYQQYSRESLHRYAEDNFSKEIIAHSFIDIYKEALKTRGHD